MNSTKFLKLKEIADITMGQSPPSDTYSKSGEMPFFQGKAEFGIRFPVVKKYCSRPIRVAEKNSILMSVRAPVGSVNIANQKACIGRGLCAIKAKSKLNYLFLFHYLKMQEKKIASQGQGSTFKAINKKVIEDIGIPVPELTEQKRIVSIIEKVESLLRKSKLAKKNLENFDRALFFEYFSSMHGNKNKSKLMTLDEIVKPEKYSLKRGPFGGSLKKSTFVGNGYKIYEQKNAIRDDCEIGTYFINSEKYEEMKAFSVNPGDLIVSCSGTIGKIAILPPNAKEGIINQALLKISPNESIVLPQYLKLLLEMPFIQNKMFLSSRGSGIQNVASMAELKKVKLPIPSLFDQKKFVHLLVKKNKINDSVLNLEKMTIILSKALMQDFFEVV